ncbi:MAG: class I SAM-dependent methyltransferase [Rhodothermales bacterium]
MNPSDIVEVAPYSAIAQGYDLIMEHVSYEYWATFTDKVLHEHHAEPRRILELGCGTGSFAVALQPLRDYEYVGTDRSPEMIEQARWKAEVEEIPAQFEVQDFTDYAFDEPFDAAVLLYDGLNYVLDPSRLEGLFTCTFAALKPGGLFFFDQSTPANSINNEAFFEDEGEEDDFSYVRGSHYDRETRLHTTTFEVHANGRSYFERHVQRAYTIDDVRAPVLKAGFEIVSAFDGFTTQEANDESERVHWIVRRPA